MQLNPYLKFNGNCRDAFEFYKQVFGGELKIQTVGESPVADQMPKETHQNIMHASLKSDDLVIMGSDMLGPHEFINGNAVALSLTCKTEAEISDHFSKLSEGGQVTNPLQEVFWGDLYGDLTDKFGMNWMLNLDRNRQ